MSNFLFCIPCTTSPGSDLRLELSGLSEQFGQLLAAQVLFHPSSSHRSFFSLKRVFQTVLLLLPRGLVALKDPN